MGEARLLTSFSSYGLQWCLKQLGREEFQTFKALLRESAAEPAAGSLPLAEVDGADAERLTSLLHEHYKWYFAWKISTDIFEKMSLSALSEMAKDEMKRYLLAEMPEDSIPTKTAQGPITEEEAGHADDQQAYKSHVISKFATKPDTHSSFKDSASDCPDVQMLLGAFHPDRAGFRPHTVVLHGKSGTGQSALARRVLLSWARGELCRGMFSYVFFLQAGETWWSGESSFAEFISKEWPDARVPPEEILSQPERLLFVLDGSEDLDLAFKDDDVDLCRDWAGKQPVSLLMRSLLRKVLLPECSLIITATDTGVEKLQPLLLAPRYLLVGGLSMEKRIQSLLGHMSRECREEHALRWVVDSHELLDQCQAPAMCSLVCEALKLQEASGKGLPPTCQTLTGLYATFVFHQLTLRDGFQCCVSEDGGVTLKGLCRMAAEGVWKAKFVFHRDDLGAHGLKEPRLSALLHMRVLLRDSGREGCYTFLHLGLQEFCAALFYVLEGLEAEGGPCPLLTETMKSVAEVRQMSANVHVAQMKRFLFGLMRKEVTATLDALLGCSYPLGVRRVLLHWISLLGQHASTAAPSDFLEAFRCLFETQDNEFVRLALNDVQEVRLQVSRPVDLMASSFCLQHCRHLRKIRLDVREIFPKHGFAETWPTLPQGLHAKRLEQHWETLCDVLSTHPNLRQLDLSGSILNELAMKTLCIKLRQPTCKIQNLIFKGAQISLGLRHLWMTLIINRNIRCLDLESTHLKEGDVMMACAALRHPKCFLESLRLDLCGLSHTCCQEISQILVTSISLRSLSLAGNKVTDQSIKPLCGALKATQCTLQKLILGNCGLAAADCQDLASALTKNQSLTHLYLSSNSLGSEGLKPLCRALKLPGCGLQRLILNACNLDVAGCGFLALALMGNRHLTHLSLSLNPLEDNGMNLLCEVMMEPSCHLQDLELVKCHLTATCCRSLSQVIMRSKHLRSLDLAANALGDNGIAALCEGLEQNSPLRRLGLEACELTSGCCEALSSALSCNKHLTSLNLMQNNFSLPGMRKLCSAFAQPTSHLQILGLWKWQYSTQIRRLLEGLQQVKPQMVIGDHWYSFAEDDRYWWKS
nr:NACHT, LRR and PYD domains-containing protein 5 [Camelus bactrianus]